MKNKKYLTSKNYLKEEVKRLKKKVKELEVYLTVQKIHIRETLEAFEEAQARNKKYVEELEETKKAVLNLLDDLAAQKKILEEEKIKEETILTSIGEGLMVTDEKGKIIFVNKMFERLLGWKAKEVYGKKAVELTPLFNEEKEVISTSQHPISVVIKKGKITSLNVGTFYYQRKDKTLFPVSLTVSPIIFEGKLIGVVEVFRDISKEKEIEKAKTEFVSLASHQLRIPLATISWYTEMLLAEDAGKLTREQKDYLEEIYTANQRMIKLVNDLLNVSRIELGTFGVKPEPTDVVKVANSVIEELKPQIQGKKIKMVKVFQKDLPILQTDPKLLRIIFQNLLSNAVKYTPEKGKVELEVSSRDGNIKIRVSDTGVGIPAYQQDKIFTKFFRADNVREKVVEGTGLGLYIVKSIVDYSKGKIWFESKEKEGTTFFVILPLKIKKKEGSKVLN